MHAADFADSVQQTVDPSRAKTLALRLRWALEAALPAIEEMRKTVPKIDQFLEDAIRNADNGPFGRKYHGDYMEKKVVERIQLALKNFPA